MKEAIITNINYVSKDGKAWADSYLKNFRISFSSMAELKSKIQEAVKEFDFVTNKKLVFKPIYRDMANQEILQVGWCFNCQIEIDMDGEFKKCNFECWVQIAEIKDLFKKVA